MRLGNRRQQKRRGAWDQTESLEPRLVLSVGTQIPIISGQTTSFTDADGSLIKIRLTGPGSGFITLQNGEVNGSNIEGLFLTETTSESRLRITSRGGTTAGTSVYSVKIVAADDEETALGSWRSRAVDLDPLGHFKSSASVGHLKLRDLGSSAQIDVTGSVDKLSVRDFKTASVIEVSATINRLTARNFGHQSRVTANSISDLNVTSLVDGATIQARTGGLGTLRFQNLQNAVVTTDGSIGSVIVTQNMTGSAIAANVNLGSDANFGTIDDYVTDTGVVGQIGSVRVNGPRTGQAPASYSIVASGAIGSVTVNGQAHTSNTSSKLLWDFVASSFISLDVSQATESATGYDDDHIWIAIFGQEIVTPLPGQVPAPGVTYYLSANAIRNDNPIALTTAALQPGPQTANQVILPSSTLSAWDGRLSLPVPAPNHQYTGRIVISVGAPAQAQVTPADGTVSAPSAGNVTDPSNGSFYDFLEFTVTNFNGVPNLDIDTSLVDSFGIPLKLQFFKDSAGTVPFNYAFTGNTTLNGNTISNIADTSNLGEGQSVEGPGIPPGTTIQGLVSSTTTTPGSITLNKPVTSAITGGQFTAIAAGPVGVKAPRDSILDGNSPDSFLQFILNKITPDNSAARPFLESYASQPTVAATVSTGVITNATNGSPIQITSVNHGLSDGDIVTVDGVQGNVAANGTYTVTYIDANTFSLNGTDGTTSATYTGGGTWSQGTITGASNSGDIVITTSSTAGLKNGDLVKIEGILGNTAANGLFEIDNVQPNSFTLVDSQGNGAYTMGGVWSVYSTPPIRLVSPKDVVEGIQNPQSSDPLNNYFNNVLDQFFLKYYSGTINGHTGGGQVFSLTSGASGSTVTYSGTTQQVGNNFVLRLNATSGSSTDQAFDFDIYYPFFETNLPDPDIYQPIFYIDGAQAPAWISNISQQYESPSQMVFACDAVFADNVSRGLTGVASSVLGDLENSISAAINRGIALNDPADWGNQQTWFVQDSQNLGAYNYWVEYWHKTGLTFGDLAYAFPYDDKFGASTNLNQNNVGLAKITLGSWSQTQTASATALTDFPVSANQGGTVTLSATVTGTSPTGTVTFYIDGVPINSQNASATPPQQPVPLDGNGTAVITANLPALPDGSITHTFTVTAIYSGDATNLPSIAYQSLQLVGSNGDFPVSASPNSGSASTPLTVTATLPGTRPGGQVTFYFANGDGSNPRVLTTLPVTVNTITADVTIPSVIVSFTGTTTSGNSVIQNVTNVTDLAPGQILTSDNLAPGTTISGFAPPQLTLSAPATQTGTVKLSSGGIIFEGTITSGSTAVVGVFNIEGLTSGSTITGQGIPSGTVITQLIDGNITLSQNANATGTATIESDGVGQVFQIQALYTPVTGDPLTGITPFSITS